MKIKRIYSSWMISYLIIICVAFVCSAGIYLMIGNVVKQEVDRSNAVILENVRLTTDSYIGDMQKIAIDIRSNNLIEKAYNSQMTENEFLYLSKQIQSELSRYQNINTKIDTIYLYLKEKDYVISANRCVAADVMYDISYKETGITLEEWKTILLSGQKSMFCQIPSRNGDAEVWQNMTLLSPFPALSDEPAAVLVVSVNDEAVSSAVERGGLKENSSLFILNAQDKVIMSSSGKQLPVTYKMLENDKQLNMRFDGTSYIVTSAKSSAMNMRYILGIPKNTYYETAIFIRNIAFAGIFIFFVIALYAAFYLLKKNYRPLHDLMGYVNDVYGIAEDDENEYHVFRKAITQAVTEKTQMQNKLKQQSNAVRDHLLNNLLKGKSENNLQMEDALFSNGVDFRGRYSRVLVFYIEYFDDLFEGSGKEIEEQTSLAFLVVRNITKEMLERHFSTVFVEVDDMMVCLCNSQEEVGEQVLMKIKETVKEAKKVIKDNFYIDFTVAVSSTHETVKGIAQAYQEAMEAMDYKMVMGSGGTICYEELDVTQENYYYPINTELIMVNALKAGEEKEVDDILNELFYQNFEKKRLSLEMAKCFISNLVSTSLKVMEDIRVQQHVNMEAETEELSYILGGTDVEVSKQKLRNIFHAICRSARLQTDTSSHRIVERVKVYVAENYMDFNLSLYSIADELGITYAYLSRVFKTETGEGLLQYINKVRMETAKKLLHETDQSVAQIAEAVGYGNSNSLIRAFKKYNGITPGKYRELNGQ